MAKIMVKIYGKTANALGLSYYIRDIIDVPDPNNNNQIYNKLMDKYQEFTIWYKTDKYKVYRVRLIGKNQGAKEFQELERPVILTKNEYNNVGYIKNHIEIVLREELIIIKQIESIKEVDWCKCQND